MKAKEPKGNRAYRRTIAKKRKKSKVTHTSTKEYEKKKIAVKTKIQNRIAKNTKRKIERIAKEEAEGGTRAELKKKMSPAERKQITRRAKRIKFFNKFKKKGGEKK